MVELVITEKPKAAQMIAGALADEKPVKKSNAGVPYYELKHKSRKIIVGCAVGHLYGLAEKKDKKRKGWTYPVFDIEWKPISEIDRSAAFSIKYLNTLKELSRHADSFTVATDYDVEGETIGLNIIRFICGQKDARRMKFSTLTKDELVSAYEHASSHLDWGQANAGLTRHELDWFYGINLSRALTSAVKEAGFFKILSAGRVQGPALKIIVDREKEIRAFRPEPFWMLELKAQSHGGEFIAWHEKDKFWKKEEAEGVLDRTKGKDGAVAEAEKSEFKQAPPSPFDLTTLQTEAYRCLRINPSRTLEIAQDLYTSGYISYPRTSSQQLPPGIGYSGILKNLSKQKEYSELCSELLKGKLQPNNGKKTDPAHPAIFPTGIPPKGLDGQKRRAYDLIVRRFLATFAEPATRQTVTLKIDVNGEMFVAKGTTTLEKGWHLFYGQYAKMKEEELPKISKGDHIRNKGIDMHDRETQPPKRYTPASIIRELEKKNLGTKATRSEIIETLYKRGYIQGQALEATDLGIQTVTTLGKYCPEIIDEELTRHFELEMEEIQAKQKTGEVVLEKAKKVLEKTLEEFRKKQKEVGEELITATRESEEKANTVGQCIACSQGTLMIKRGKFGRFIACSRYPECSATFKIPSTGLLKPTQDTCKECSHPIVLMIRRGKQPQPLCINPLCPSKNTPADVKEKPCQKCSEGTMVLRTSIYGGFLACNRFPKCRNIEKLKNPVK
ncbi:DNA topoisomerase I [Candidatus Woesearchaeota archaeon]|nr:DNA topoisomerase I [Candidatus Woesearchaeota archaeon]